MDLRMAKRQAGAAAGPLLLLVDHRVPPAPVFPVPVARPGRA